MLWTVSKVTRNCLLISNLKTSNNNYKTSNNNVSAYDAVERLQPLMISVHTLLACQGCCSDIFSLDSDFLSRTQLRPPRKAFTVTVMKKCATIK